MSTTALSAAPRTATAFTVIPSPVGPLTLIGTDRALTAVLFDGDDIVAASPHLEPAEESFADATEQFAAYFAGELRDFDLALDPHGTDFQRRVWAELLAIPYGETRTYGQLAANLGSPGASRAVGLANGSNPLSIVVPCHRVIGSTGKLTGYAGGMDRKRLLLDLEAGITPLA